MFVWFLFGFSVARFSDDTSLVRIVMLFLLSTMIAGGMALRVSESFHASVDTLISPLVALLDPLMRLCHREDAVCMIAVRLLCEPFVYLLRLLAAMMIMALGGAGLIVHPL
jgi:hypothetical protein